MGPEQDVRPLRQADDCGLTGEQGLPRVPATTPEHRCDEGRCGPGQPLDGQDSGVRVEAVLDVEARAQRTALDAGIDRGVHPLDLLSADAGTGDDEARRDDAAPGVDDPGPGRNGHVRSHRGDPSVLDQHGARGDLAGLGQGVDVGVGDGQGFGRSDTGQQGRGQRGRQQGLSQDAHQRLPPFSTSRGPGWPSSKSLFGCLAGSLRS